MTEAKKLYFLLCGFEILSKTVSTKNVGSRFVMAEPIGAFLVEKSDGSYFLFDTGLDSYNLKDPIRRAEYYYRPGWIPPPVVHPDHELLYQLEQIGVKPEQVTDVAVSHVHADHTGNIKHFRHARIHIQRREYEYGMHEATPENAVFKTDFDFPDIEWNLLDGDYEVAAGIELIDTRGHMPGHQSCVVTLPNSGVKVMPADAGDLMENYEQEILPGQTVDDEAARKAIRRLKNIVDSTHGEFLLTHDPVRIQQVKLAPEFYD